MWALAGHGSRPRVFRSPRQGASRPPKHVALRCHSTHTETQAASAAQAPGQHLLEWLQENGATQQFVELRTLSVPSAGRPLDVTVAKTALRPGDLALSVPMNLIVTLDSIFESSTLAELLTAGKLSELAVLTLYLMYEKKVGKSSRWWPYIKELDRQRARGVQAVESPLLWSDAELQELLQGSPVVADVRQRLDGIRREYEELDTVWFMAGSLFNRYPFDLPTEAFSFDLFKQAFAAVQASIVHLQGVPPPRRFALVPLGPPLLSYSSSCKAMLAYSKDRDAVQLVVDREYAPGDPVYAWCGPQPNNRLLLNYGIVDENNPYDKLRLTVTLSSADPLYKVKRGLLQDAGLSTMQTFDMTRSAPLPPMLLPHLRLVLSSTSAAAHAIDLSPTAPPSAAPAADQAAAAALLAEHLRARLAAYRHPAWRDLEILDDPSASPRQKVAARLTKIEKGILQGGLDAAVAAGGGQAVAARPQYPVKLS